MSTGTGDRGILGSSAVMAAGTVVSRLSGFVRTGMLAAALGNGLGADVFNIANTVPNMLYILLAGGVFNAVLVPQLVRAQKHDADGGDAYANRIVTLAGLFLAGASAVLVLAAPVLMRLFVDPSYFAEACSQPREAMISFARYCLPQVFFYGMFVLVGQVLNARGSFGPMMWAPIANNVVSVAVLGAYLGLWGTGSGVGGAYTPGQEALLGLGSTLGIAVQLLVLVPYLRATGFRFRLRFDFRGTGLGHTLRLGTWTVLFVIVNQVAYTVVVRLASAGPIDAAAGCGGGAEATGYTVYSYAFLLVMVPHSIVTVSLATAILPRLSGYAADGELRAVGTEVSAVVRTTACVMVPLMAVVPIIAGDLSGLAYGYGKSADTAGNFAPSVALFALGVLFFTVHYLMLRGFYALEQTRRVFWIQCVVAGVNVIAAVLLTRGAPAPETAPRLVIAYTLAYAVGAAVSLVQLRGQTGTLDAHRLVRLLVRLLIATAIATAIAWAAYLGVDAAVSGTEKAAVLLRLAVAGSVQAVVILVLARLMRIREIDDLRALVARRLAR